MPTPTLALKPPVSENIVFVDGVTRAGKSLLSRVISNYADIEQYQYVPLFENIANMHLSGQIDEHTAACFLQMHVDEAIYNRSIGRNLNTRCTDLSTIYQAADVGQYFRRSTMPDGRPALDAYNEAGRIAAFVTHSIISSGTMLYRALPYLKILYVCRHPVDLAEAWYRRGWGHRWASDPLVFNLILEVDGVTVPWYAYAWANAYDRMNPVERCAESILGQQELDQQGIASLEPKARKQVLEICFEHFVTEPDVSLKAIADFLGSSPHMTMPSMLLKERVPRILSTDSRKARLDLFRREASPQVVKHLIDMSRAYELRWGLPPVV